MKGVSYLIDDSGKKTHVVLDLDLWSEWRQFFRDEEVLLSRSVDDLQNELNDLEQDLPPSELGEWLAAFENA